MKDSSRFLPVLCVILVVVLALGGAALYFLGSATPPAQTPVQRTLPLPGGAQGSLPGLPPVGGAAPSLPSLPATSGTPARETVSNSTPATAPVNATPAAPTLPALPAQGAAPASNIPSPAAPAPSLPPLAPAH